MTSLENGLIAAYERQDRYHDSMPYEEETRHTDAFCACCGRELTEAECTEEGEWHEQELCEECWQDKIDRGEE